MAAHDRKNSEGYSDPTAYEAMKNLDREDERRVILNICEMAGFEIRGPIILVDKKTGKVWR